MLPSCPNCGSRLQYAVINVVVIFRCPECNSELIVSDDYRKRVKLTCFALAALFCFFLARKNLSLLVLTPAVFFLVVFAVTFSAKRIFRPPLEDVVARSKAARYTAL
jgi:hypothetical protein